MTQVIPAEAGWAACDPLWDTKLQKAVGLTWEPLIGWLVAYNVEALYAEPQVACWPLTQAGVEMGSVLRRPDGSFFAPEVQELRDTQAVLDYLNKEQ